MESKNKLRRRFKQLRREMHGKSEFDERIFKQLISCEQYNQSDLILAYVSSDIEVDTHKLISYSLEIGKKVAVPKCKTDDCTMQFYIIKSTDDLLDGAYSIKEPNVLSCVPAQITEKSLCVVPGLSFDLDGFRLGFGKGYYDRFLSGFCGTSVGLCYENCLCNEIIRDIYDRNVSLLITEKQVYSIDK